jgi:signal transduction histidine kinase/ligand-binding sensor domain-containing protein
MARAFCGWLLAANILLLSCQVHAEPRPWTLDRYQHVAWTGKNGAPTGVGSLAQTSDGYLWIGTDHGLYRFDGVRFERFEEESPSRRSVPGLYASSDGGLWISYEFGGVGFLRDGHITHYGAKAGLPDHGQIEGFAEDRHAAIWAYGDGGLYTLVGERWKNMGGDLGFRGNYATFLFIARDDTFWVGAGDGLFYRAADAKQFVHLEKEGYVSHIVQAADGGIWVAHLRGAIERWTTTSAALPVRAPGSIATTSAERMLFDHQGGLWINGLGDGVRHIAPYTINQHTELSALIAKAELFNSSNGLSGDYVWPLLIDREGNIWVGTGAGLDRFSRSNFTPAPFPAGTHDFALAAGADGSVWTGSSSKPVMELKDSQVKTFDVPPYTLAAYADRDGVVYIGGVGGIWKMSDAGAEHLASRPNANAQAFGLVLAITKDLHDTLWVSVGGTAASGLYTWANGQWKKWSISGTPRANFTDGEGRVWLGYRDNRIVVVDGDSVTTLGPHQGVTIGDAKSFQRNGQRLWIGGSDGLGYMDGLRLKMVGTADGGSLKNVTGIVFSAQGDLWVHTLDGVFQLPAKDVRQAEINPSYPMHFRKFDTLDGLPGSPALQYPLPSAVRSTDGRLWFATSNGVVWLDPAQLISNPLPPRVVIDSIEADGKAYAPQGRLTLPAHTENLRITFSVLSLTLPERVDAKIRMRGLDNDWRDVGLQREVSYSNLGPGSHHFDVIGANEDGVWNKVGESIEFSITPAFYQTLWFVVLCACIAVLALWQVFVFRLRQVNRRLHLRLEVRHAERERIARDLHDTLLQSFPGLLMKMQAGVSRLPLPEDAAERQFLNLTLDQAQDIVVESRDLVSRLRSEEYGNLAEVLSVFSEGQASGHGMTLNVLVDGRERNLRREIFEEASFIMKEAMLNAYKHSGGKLLSVHLGYCPDALLLEVQDNGNGIDPAILDAGEKPGHWGLMGMRERAKQMSAKLSIESQPGKGTSVTLWVPGRIAYATYPMTGRFFWSRHHAADV